MTNSQTSLDITNLQADLADAAEALEKFQDATGQIAGWLSNIYNAAADRNKAFGADDISRDRLESLENAWLGVQLDFGSLQHMIMELQSFTAPATKIN